jgi:7-carboxy-7-deazaguanine synthase
MRYPLSPRPIFQTVQGEGYMLGRPMTFLRLAGCSVGCPLCDTDYRVDSRATVGEIVERVKALPHRLPWVWVTGGEPTDHDLWPLIRGLKAANYHVALATAGHRELPYRTGPDRVGWLSVSPHDPAAWRQFSGDEVKLVPGLNGHRLADFTRVLRFSTMWFGHRYVSPCAGDPTSVAECVEWVMSRPGWVLTCQAHKQWGLA